MKTTEERVNLARLNWQAGKMTAVSSKTGALLLSSGMLPSASYFRQGLELMEAGTRWQQQYDLCLDLATSVAEEEMSAGRFTECAEIAHEVIENAKSLRESLRVHMALIKTLFMEGRIKDVAKYCLVLLSQLGIHLPKEPHKGHVAMELIKTKVATRRLPIAYAETKNEETIVAMQTLAVFIMCSFLTEKKAFVTIATCRMIRLSLRFGLSKYSPIGFASYAMVHASMNKRGKSILYGKLSMDLVDRLNAGNEVRAKVEVVAMGFSLYWMRPWSESLKAQKLGYRKGLETSDVDCAFLCAHTVVLLAFVSGTKLRECEELGELLCTQMVKHSQITWWSMTLPMWQMFQCLMKGHDGRSLLLTGDVMDQEEMETNASLQGNHVLIRAISLSRLFLACLSSSWKQADDLVRHVDDHMEALSVYVLFPVYKFLAALTWLVRSGAMFVDKERQRMYRWKAKQVMRRMERWISDGAINVRPLWLILIAEEVAHKGSPTEIKEAFQVAIAECQNHTLPHFQAMANERAGVLLTVKLHTESATSYLTAAKDLYKEYGATGKVRDLEEKIQSSLFTKTTDYEACPVVDITFNSSGIFR
jgi:predicted ATPase